MKKNYFYALFASLMLFMAMPANAQISSMTELYGRYKFTQCFVNARNYFF